MFGLTRREQRWKSEQRCAEMLAGLLAGTVRVVGDIRVAEAKIDKELSLLLSEIKAQAVEIQRLREALETAEAVQAPTAASYMLWAPSSKPAPPFETERPS